MHYWYLPGAKYMATKTKLQWNSSECSYNYRLNASPIWDLEMRILIDGLATKVAAALYNDSALNEMPGC